jgi:hypothetical protein
MKSYDAGLETDVAILDFSKAFDTFASLQHAKFDRYQTQRISREKHDIFIFIDWSFLIRHKEKINKTEGQIQILQKCKQSNGKHV